MYLPCLTLVLIPSPRSFPFNSAVLPHLSPSFPGLQHSDLHLYLSSVCQPWLNNRITWEALLKKYPFLSPAQQTESETPAVGTRHPGISICWRPPTPTCSQSWVSLFYPPDGWPNFGLVFPSLFSPVLLSVTDATEQASLSSYIALPGMISETSLSIFTHSPALWDEDKSTETRIKNNNIKHNS